jgi:acid phosphatase class B
MDVVTRLSYEHEQLSEHLTRIQTAAEMRDDDALRTALRAAGDAIADELDAHIALEEAVVFSAIGATLGEELVAPFRAEHIRVRALRDAVRAGFDRGEAPYSAAPELCDLILSHQQREDQMLFPSARLETLP